MIKSIWSDDYCINSLCRVLFDNLNLQNLYHVQNSLWGAPRVPFGVAPLVHFLDKLVLCVFEHFTTLDGVRDGLQIRFVVIPVTVVPKLYI